MVLPTQLLPVFIFILVPSVICLIWGLRLFCISSLGFYFVCHKFVINFVGHKRRYIWGNILYPRESRRDCTQIKSFSSPVSALFSKCRTTKVRMADMLSLLSFLHMVFNVWMCSATESVRLTSLLYTESLVAFIRKVKK